MKTLSKYPEHEKLAGHRSTHSAIESFLNFILEERGYTVVDDDDRSQSAASLIAEFFDIDMQKWYAEKDMMLEEIRRIQNIKAEGS